MSSQAPTNIGPTSSTSTSTSSLQPTLPSGSLQGRKLTQGPGEAKIPPAQPASSQVSLQNKRPLQNKVKAVASSSGANSASASSQIASPKISGAQMVSSFLKSIKQAITTELKQTFWVKRTETQIPKLSETNATVMKIAAQKQVQPKQIVENFETAAKTMQTIATTLAQLEQFIEAGGKPSGKMMKFQDTLRNLANELAASMETFTQAESVVEGMNAADGTGDEKLIEKNYEQFQAQAGMALGIANFESRTKEAEKFMQDIADAATSGELTEEILRVGLEKTSEAMELMKEAQKIEKPVIKLANKANLRSKLAQKIAGTKSKLANLVKDTSTKGNVQDLLKESAAKKEIEQAEIQRKIEEAIAEGKEEEELEIEPTKFAHDVIAEIDEKVEEIEQGPAPEKTLDQLSVEERELYGYVQYSLEHAEDGLCEEVKTRLEDFVTRSFKLKKEVAGKSFEAMSSDQKFDLAQLYVELLVIYYDNNKSLSEVVQTGKTEAIYATMTHLAHGANGIYGKMVNLLPSICSDLNMRKLFTFVDSEQGSVGKGDISERMELVFKKAWDLYFDFMPQVVQLGLCERDKLSKKENIRKYLSDGKLYE